MLHGTGELVGGIEEAEPGGDIGEHVAALERVGGIEVDGVLVDGCAAYLECELDRIVDVGPGWSISLISEHTRRPTREEIASFKAAINERHRQTPPVPIQVPGNDEIERLHRRYRHWTAGGLA